MNISDASADVAAVFAAMLTVLTAIALLWTWFGGLAWWRRRRARRKRLDGFWEQLM